MSKVHAKNDVTHGFQINVCDMQLSNSLFNEMKMKKIFFAFMFCLISLNNNKKSFI